MDVAFEPWEKVSFKSHMSYSSSEAFVNAITMASPAGIPGRLSLYWANGILFRYFPLAPSEPIAKEYLKGHLIWDHIEFAPMPTYTREIQTSERPLITVYVHDVTNHIVLGSVTKWINENLIEKKSIK